MSAFLLQNIFLFFFILFSPHFSYLALNPSHNQFNGTSTPSVTGPPPKKKNNTHFTPSVSNSIKSYVECDVAIFKLNVIIGIILPQSDKNSKLNFHIGA
jgi:hypothetical protein